MTNLTSTVRNRGEGEQRWFSGGGLHTWKATSEETGGAFLLFEAQVDAGKVTPLHTHPEADEAFYILEGRILLHLDGEQRELEAGGIAVIPRGIPHAFMAGPDGARMLCLQTPGSGDDFFFLASDPASGQAPLAVDFDRVLAAAQQTGGMEFLGPPPF